MNAIILILLAAVILVAVIAAALVMLLVAIRIDGRRMNLTDEAHTHRRTLVRRMLGVYASQPEEVPDACEDVRR